jgi:hypothetical protein
MEGWYPISKKLLLKSDYGKLKSEYICERFEKTKFYSDLLNKYLSNEKQNDIQNGVECLNWTDIVSFDIFQIRIVIAINITNDISTYFISFPNISINDAINLRKNSKFREFVKLIFYIEDIYKDIKDHVLLE